MRDLLVKETKNSGLTVNEIATKLKISESFYYKILSGARNPSMNLSKKIANIFGKTVDEIFFNNEMDETSNKTKPA